MTQKSRPCASCASAPLRSLRVDLGDDIYTRMRKYQGIVYDEALDAFALVPAADSQTAIAKEEDAVAKRAAAADRLRLFLPGCALASYSEELTTTVFEHLRATAGVTGISTQCCGAILRGSATGDERDRYQQRLSAALSAIDAGTLIVACPNCYQAYGALEKSGRLPGIELCALPAVLAAQGMRFVPREPFAFASVCVHDSCPDRRLGVFSDSVRALFSSIELREMEHIRHHSRCCGAGRLLPLKNPALSARLRSERVAEFVEAGAECLLASCANCAQAFSDLEAYHYLELLFGVAIDWDAVAAAQAACR
jgi:Fe-S oxidoreductase